MIRRRRRVMLGTVGGVLLLCLLYCLVAPYQYEASSTVALRIQASSSLSLEAAESIAPASILSTPLQLETLVNVFRSERLAWRVITEMKLYQSAVFSRSFAGRFPNFHAEKPSPEAQEYLLKSFFKRLYVRTLPRTLLIEIRFRSKDPALAAAVVNALVRDYAQIEGEARLDATQQSSSWLQVHLTQLTAQAESDERHLAEFEQEHGLLSSAQNAPDGQPVEALHDPAAQQVDEAGRQLAAASGNQILREALYREAQQGDPEQVLSSDPEAESSSGAAPGGAVLLRQLHAQQSEVGVELAQLALEHGPNFPRVIELRRAMDELAGQVKAEDAKLLEGFRLAAQAAADREQTVRRQLEALTAEGMRHNDTTTEYAVLRGRVTAGRELCARLERRIQEAGLSAGVHASSITVVDAARVPYRPVAPDLPLYMGIALVAALWLALALGLLLDALRPATGVARSVVVSLVLMAALVSAGLGQAPTPNTSGLPSGVVRIPEDAPAIHPPDPHQAPPTWNSAAPQTAPLAGDAGTRFAGVSIVSMALPIGAGDFLEVSEFHTPEFRSSVRVAADGTVLLPMIGEVRLLGLTEQQASRRIEKALLDGGLLLHPQVTVLVTAAVGQDVSVLGEVTRPGVYPYTAHHRLLDLISAASGLSANAGRLVSIFHRDDPHTGHPVVLDPSGSNAADDHNPELAPGDTVEVSRAGLAYVIGDVVRPGGFAVDPAQGLTVVQALSLAWGSTPNAANSRAILIRNQPGGRTLTTLNLRRMIRGQDPDVPVRDRDILFVPDSVTKNLLNKSLESAIQSAIGVTIYAGLVYSQRF